MKWQTAAGNLEELEMVSTDQTPRRGFQHTHAQGKKVKSRLTITEYTNLLFSSHIRGMYH